MSSADSDESISTLGEHPAPAAAEKKGPGRKRKISEPYKDRQDVGRFGVYQATWSGRRKQALLRDHIFNDIVVKCPTNILCA